MKNEPEKEPKGISKYITILMPVFITALAGIAGTTIMTRYQDKTAATTIISQREQAESNLRATMFTSLINTVFTKNGNSKSMPIDHEVILLEMLALNFSENFEFKPLIIHVDEVLEKELHSARGAEREYLEKERRNLLSTSRKVVARQIAMLNSGNTDNEKTVSDRLFFTDPTGDNNYLEIQRANYKEKIAFTRISTSSEVAPVSTASGAPSKDSPAFEIHQEICLTSPDRHDLLLIDIDKALWSKHNFIVHVVANDISRHKLWESPVKSSQSWCREIATKAVIDPRYPTMDMNFTVTPFDFPLTDNTLLASGNRFAVTIESTHSSNIREGGFSNGLPSNVVFEVIWFPKSYFTARERPINYSEFRRKLRIEVK